MSIISTKVENNPIIEQILAGQHIIFDNFINKQSAYDFVKDTLLEAIEVTESHECSQQVKKSWSRANA